MVNPSLAKAKALAYDGAGFSSLAKTASTALAYTAGVTAWLEQFEEGKVVPPSDDAIVRYGKHRPPRLDDAALMLFNNKPDDYYTLDDALAAAQDVLNRALWSLHDVLNPLVLSANFVHESDSLSVAFEPSLFVMGFDRLTRTDYKTAPDNPLYNASNSYVAFDKGEICVHKTRRISKSRLVEYQGKLYFSDLQNALLGSSTN